MIVTPLIMHIFENGHSTSILHSEKELQHGSCCGILRRMLTRLKKNLWNELTRGACKHCVIGSCGHVSTTEMTWPLTHSIIHTRMSMISDHVISADYKGTVLCILYMILYHYYWVRVTPMPDESLLLL